MAIALGILFAIAVGIAIYSKRDTRTLPKDVKWNSTPRPGADDDR